MSRRSSGHITADRLRELLDYNPETGVFTWRVSRSRVAAGAVAGPTAQKGYFYIYVEGRSYCAHRLAWLHVTGKEPQGIVDHKNRDPSDNRFANLRVATKGQNAVNTATRVPSLSGKKGVTPSGYPNKQWNARIKVNGRQIHLGSFESKEDASKAYEAARVRFFGEFSP